MERSAVSAIYTGSPVFELCREFLTHHTRALSMSAGSIVGGYFGARLTMHERAKFWIFRILVV